MFVPVRPAFCAPLVPRQPSRKRSIAEERGRGRKRGAGSLSLERVFASPVSFSPFADSPNVFGRSVRTHDKTRTVSLVRPAVPVSAGSSKSSQVRPARNNRRIAADRAKTIGALLCNVVFRSIDAFVFNLRPVLYQRQRQRESKTNL